ncbi:hypothetical protein [Roseateles asaccharophilus]|uniref:Lipoprotein n=1 Tax=Roseateles asaccharophilus TaxID=582607 RepID=A0ABU2A6K3_9BURK|nr:hypothetical protein [Roseateles asaccharophilus]MDR7332233.1 hypothetical protein [Roseateles asaccharophilus]
MRLALLLLSLTPAMTGCAVFEALGGMPYAEKTVRLPQAVSAATALDCVASSVQSLREGRGTWMAVSRRDDAQGLLETGNYPESNLAGFRVRARVDEPRRQMRLQLKAGGPYYIDLGAKPGVAELAMAVDTCLAAAAAQREHS